MDVESWLLVVGVAFVCVFSGVGFCFIDRCDWMGGIGKWNGDRKYTNARKIKEERIDEGMDRKELW